MDCIGGPGGAAEALVDLRYTRAAEYGLQTIIQLAGLLDATPAPAFLVYTSDHGENLPSDHNGVQWRLATSRCGKRH